jgi:hypothetical protein
MPKNLLERSVAAQKEAASARALEALRERADERRFMTQVSEATGNMGADHPGALPRAYGEMGPISKLIWPQAQAITGPAGAIYYNRKLINKDKVPVSDIVRHEMTHVGQGPRAILESMVSPKARDQYEQEAQLAEAIPTPAQRANTPASGGPPVPPPPMYRNAYSRNRAALESLAASRRAPVK